MYGQYPGPASYVMISPQHHPYQYPKSSGCSFGTFFRCLCCILCFLWLLFLLSLTLLYMLYKPKLPLYNLDHFLVNAFSIDPNTTVATTGLQLRIRAENPNARVSLTYGPGSSVSVLYDDHELCNGKLPEFVQGYHNVTEVEINLYGTTSLGVLAAQSLKENQGKGVIELVAKVKAPISASFGDFRVRVFVFHICIHIILDNLSPDRIPKVLSTTYQFFFDHHHH